MKVVILQTPWWNPFGMLISCITDSAYSHAGIVAPNGHVIDANMQHGAVRDSGPLVAFGNRRVQVWNMPGDIEAGGTWVLAQIGKKYDFAGVLGFLWGANGQRSFYCFEFVIHAICVAKGWPLPVKNRFTAHEVIWYLDTLGAKPIYDGPAKGFA